MVARDGVTEVVVPVRLHGPPLVTGAPTRGAVTFFIEVLGLEPVVTHGAWSFEVPAVLPAPRLHDGAVAARCASVVSPAGFADCVYRAAR